MNTKQFNLGFEDARQGREKLQGQCDEYNRGWAEGELCRSPASHINYMSGGRVEYKEFQQLSGLAPRTLSDWFYNSRYRVRLNCMIAGAVALKSGKGEVVKRIRRETNVK